MNRRKLLGVAGSVLLTKNVAGCVDVSGPPLGRRTSSTQTVADDGGSSIESEGELREMADPPETITVVDFPVVSMPFVYYPIENGLFEKRGLDVELTDKPVLGGSRVMNAVISGGADIATAVANSGPINLMREQDVRMKMIYPALQVKFADDFTGGTYVILNEDYDSVADIEGEELAVQSGESGILTTSARWVVDQAGLDPFEDVSIRYVPLPQIAGTVEQGEAAAGVLLEPRVLAAEGQGMGIKRGAAAFGWAGEASLTGHLVKPEFVENYPYTVKLIQNALAETHERASNDPSAFIEFSSERLDIDVELLEAMWERGYYGQPVTEYDTEKVLDGYEATQDLLVDYTDANSRIDVEKFVIEQL